MVWVQNVDLPSIGFQTRRKKKAARCVGDSLILAGPIDDGINMYMTIGEKKKKKQKQRQILIMFPRKITDSIKFTCSI